MDGVSFFFFLWEQGLNEKRGRSMKKLSEGSWAEQSRVRMQGTGGAVHDGTYREGYDICGPDRCYDHSHRLSERHRQCEKLMCPTYCSWAETGAGGWEAGMMLDFRSEQSMLCFFFPLVFVHYITPICFWMWVYSRNLFSFPLRQHVGQLCCSVF